MATNQGRTDAVIDLVKEYTQARQRHSEVLNEIEALQRERNELEELLGAYGRILELKGIEHTPWSNGVQTHDGGHVLFKVSPTDDAEDALLEEVVPIPDDYSEMVVGLMRTIFPKSLHYRDIYKELESRGLVMGGKDPANTLLARFSSDDRLQRISRGTYRAKPIP